jgi:hypothetical protein
MNKSYLIVPAVLLIVFGYFYNGALQEMRAKADAQQAATARVKAEEKKHKEEIDAKATADAQQRQEKREAEDRAKETKRQRDYDDALKQLKDETANYTSEANRLAKEAADLELQISQTRTANEQFNRETLELAKQVEQAKINRRNAELEIQRMIETVDKRISDNTSIAIPPPPPSVAAK